jgi:ADP-heptose:LPS heptosyltransferase
VINFFLSYKTRDTTSHDITLKDIQKANKILFALFTRYGDTIIDLVVIKEFIEQYPSKDYLILCPKQMQPYVNEFLPNLKSIGVNKRNWIEIFKLDSTLKKWKPDIGFNPWSNGLDSCYFLSYCKIYQFYKDYNKPKPVNHYQIVRSYLRLKEKVWQINSIELRSKYKKVLICPESTDSLRSFSNKQLDEIIDNMKFEFDTQYISIASMSKEFSRENCNSFIFSKTSKSSESFIELLKKNDLVVCADSAPLHIASALGKDVIAVFNSTNPNIVINTGDKIIIYENE